MHVFAVLGEPIRFRIVEVLASGTHLAGELTDVITHEFAVSRAAVSHHLRILRDEGLVAVHPQDNKRLYRLRWNALEQVDRVLLDLYEKWDARTDWPYETDPFASVQRRHRLAERSRRPAPTWQQLVEPSAPVEYAPEWDEDDEEQDENIARDAGAG